FKSKIQHVLFHGRRLAGLLAPRLVHIDVAGRARAGAATLRLDPRHAVFDRRFHHGRPDLAVDRARDAAGIDIGNLGHESASQDREMPARLKAGRPGANGPLLYRFERYAPTPSRRWDACSVRAYLSEKSCPAVARKRKFSSCAVARRSPRGLP